MKPISELGLELIELEDQVLLVDSKWKYKNEGLSIHFDMLSMKSNATLSGWVGIGFINNHKEIIASTKPLEGLPLLVIEDEVEKLADIYGDKLTDNPTEVEDAFIAGYNKAKETYKFTEEDLRKAISMARDYTSDVAGYQKDEITQSLTKKELWIEVEEWSLAENVEAKNQNVPKIVNNQIKAVWN